MLLGTDSKGRTAWHLAANEGNVQVLHKIFECAEKKLTREEINAKLLLGTDFEGMTAWHGAAENGKVQAMQEIWEWAEKKLTREEIKCKFLLHKTLGRNLWCLEA